MRFEGLVEPQRTPQHQIVLPVCAVLSLLATLALWTLAWAPAGEAAAASALQGFYCPCTGADWGGARRSAPSASLLGSAAPECRLAYISEWGRRAAGPPGSAPSSAPGLPPPANRRLHSIHPFPLAGLQQLLLLCEVRLVVLTCIGAASYRALTRSRRGDSPTPGSGGPAPSPRGSLTQAALCLQLAWLATELVLGSGLLLLHPYLLGEDYSKGTRLGVSGASRWLGDDSMYASCGRPAARRCRPACPSIFRFAAAVPCLPNACLAAMHCANTLHHCRQRQRMPPCPPPPRLLHPPAALPDPAPACRAVKVVALSSCEHMHHSLYD